MIFILTFLISMLGASIASFICVQMEGGGRGDNFRLSKCDGCDRKLSWYQKIPFFSTLFYVLKKKTCKNCDYSLSLKYLIMEFSAGIFLLFLFLYILENKFLENLYILQLFTASVFTYFIFTLSYQDYLYKQVFANYLYLFIAFCSIFTFYNLDLQTLFLIIAFPVFLIIFSIISKEKWLGLGDPLAILATFLFFHKINVSAPVNILLYSIWSGALISVLIMFIKEKKYVKNFQISFLPFLTLGIFILLISNFYLIQVSDIMDLWIFLKS